MKVIVTGGEGFIGRALTATLSSRGVETISIDRKCGIEAGEYFSTMILTALMQYSISPPRHPFSIRTALALPSTRAQRASSFPKFHPIFLSKERFFSIWE